jgi:hypothetical protein
MTREVVTVDEETLFKEITQLLADCRISAVPVLTPTGGWSGSSPRPTCSSRRNTSSPRQAGCWRAAAGGRPGSRRPATARPN